MSNITANTSSNIFYQARCEAAMLLDITADGVIDESEKPELEEIVKNLEEVEGIAQSMKL